MHILKRNRVIFSVIVVLTMVIGLITGSSIASVNAANTDLSPYVTSLQLTKTATWETISNNESLKHGEGITLKMTYDIPGDIYKNEKVYTYQLPKTIKVGKQNGNINKGSNAVGTYAVTDEGLVTFTFNSDYNTENLTITNDFTISGFAEYSPNATEDEKKFLFQGGETVIVVTNEGGFTVKKSVNTDYNVNRKLSQNDVIKYTVQVDSPVGTNDKVTVEDKITLDGEGIESVTIDANSIKVVDADKKEVTGYNKTVSSDGKSYTITDLPQLGKNGSYKITYNANVKLKSDVETATKVNNNVEVTSVTKETDSKSVEYKNIIKKSAVSYSENLGFRWKLRGYTNGMNLTGVTVTDTSETKMKKILNIKFYNKNGRELTTLFAKYKKSRSQYEEDHDARYNTSVLNQKANKKIDGNTMSFTFPDADYSQVAYWEVEYYTEGKLKDNKTEATDKNSVIIKASDGSTWERKDVEGIGKNVTVSIDKKFVEQDSETDQRTLYWSFTANYKGLENKDDNSIEIRDDMSGYYRAADNSEYASNHIHFSYAAELDKALKDSDDGLKITAIINNKEETFNYQEAISKGYKINFTYKLQSSDTVTVAASDTEKHLRFFGIKVTAPNNQKLTITKITVNKYPTHYDGTEVEALTNYTQNYITTEGVDDTEVRTITNTRGSISKLVYNDEAVISSDDVLMDYKKIKNGKLQGKVPYVLLATVQEGDTSVTIKDKLPDGLSLSNIRSKGDWHVDRTSSVAVYAMNSNVFDFFKWSDEARSNHVHINYDEKENTITVTVTGIGSDIKLNDNNIVAVQLNCDITENLDELEGSQVTTTTSGAYVYHTFKNTAYVGNSSASINATVYKEENAISKKGAQSSTESNIVNYEININEKALDLMENSDTLEIEDTIESEKFSVELDRKSIKLYERNKDGSKGKEVEIESLKINQPVTEKNKSSQTFEIKVKDEKAYILAYRYKTALLENQSGDGELKNTAKMNGIITKTDDSQVKNNSSSANSNFAGLQLYKVDEDNNAEYLNNAKFKLEEYKNGNYETVINEFDVSGENGYIFDYFGSNQLNGNTLYRIVETKAPKGYHLNKTPYYFIIKGNIEDVRKGSIGTNEITVSTDAEAKAAANAPNDITINYLSPNSYTAFDYTNKSKLKETIDIEGKKTWVDDNNSGNTRPETITVELYADDTKVSEQVVRADENGNWSYKFEGVKKYNSDESEIKYTVKEVKVTDYKSEVSGYNIKNTLNKKVNISVNKVWVDNNNQDGKQAKEVIVHLYSNRVDTNKTVTLNANNNWSGSFKDLNEKDENGNKIEYSVAEEAVAGYSSNITGTVESGFTITNTHKPETTKVEGKKVWKDANNQDNKRPEKVTIKLVATVDGNEVASLSKEAEVSEDNNWAYSFTDLPKYHNGKAVTYSLKEATVPTGYTSKVVGNNVENTYTPETTKVEGEKTWDDGNNQDKKRPTSITVNLLADGTKVDSKAVEADENGKWTYSFTNLPKNKNGQPITYSVVEEKVDGYTVSYDGYNIKNTYTPESTEVSVFKDWKDDSNRDGIRPSSITVKLFADKVDTGKTVELNASNKWKASFTNLPKNNNGQEITYTIEEVSVDGYSSIITGDATNGFTITNTHEIEKTEVKVSKDWQDNYNQDGIRPNDVTVKLLANGKDTGKTVVLNSGNKWSASFTNLAKKEAGKDITYSLEEVTTTIITGVDGAGTYAFKVEKDANEVNKFVIINTHTPEKTEVSGEKTWDDGNNQDGKRPTSITVNLVVDNNVIDSKVVSADANGKWLYSFTNLDKYKDGQPITYTITEEKVAEYTTSVTGYNIKNSYTPGKTNVKVTKDWQDDYNRDNVRPSSITVKLKANGVDTNKTLVLNEANKWNGEFTDLAEKANGKTITYTIEEVGVKKYKSTITGDATIGFTITNSYTPETIEIAGEKTWDDKNDQDGKRPESITVNLLADGTKVDSKTVSADENGKWTYSFTGLNKYRDQGQKINYTITEDKVNEYSTNVSGYNITNSYTPGKTNVSVIKKWEDSNNQDGIRPESVTVKLLADGKDTGKTVTLSETNKWTASFTDLDEKAKGKTIVYTIEELKVTNYKSVITGSASEGFIITNSYTPKTTEVKGTKTWVDANNQDNVRPTSITIHLYANNTLKESKVVTPDNNGVWSYEFTNLPLKENGNVINYTVQEDNVKPYTAKVEGYNITNTYNPKKRNISVIKKWEDNNNQDGIRPESVTVKLLADGKDTGKTVVLSDGNKWTASFDDLDVNKEGKEINYSIDEVKTDVITGKDTAKTYSVEVTGSMENGYIITNSHTPETTKVNGTKTWDDKENQDGVRPESIKVQLLADNKVVETKTVTANDKWSYSFDNLPKYRDQGTEIIYTISEEVDSKYTPSYDGYNIKNSYTPKTTFLEVNKSWLDDNNRDGIRPEKVVVKLLADGKDTGKTVTLSKDNNWRATFNDLAVNKPVGSEIKYTVEEEDVEGYKANVISIDINKFTIENTHTPETVKVNGTKTWDDKDDQDGKRSESITVRLLANGKEIDSTTVTADDNWKYEFTNLYKYENGKEISYTVSEDEVKEYSTTYNGNDITNSYTPEKRSITVNKAWDDQNNKDGSRPTSIKVQLYANGKKVGNEVTLSEANNWRYTFTDLDVKANKKDIEYSVKEVSEVKGYTKVEGEVINGNVTITNSHTPKSTKVKTGDFTNISMLMITLLLSLLVIVSLLKKRFN